MAERPLLRCAFQRQLNHLGLPADVLVGKLKKDITFALRRGTSAQVTTALDAAQRAVEEYLILNEAGWDRYLLPSPICDDALTHPT